MLVFLANSIPFPFILSKCLPFWCVQSVEVVLRNCCWHNMAAHQLWPFVTQSQRPAAKFLSYQLINTQPCSLHVVDFRPRLNHPRWLSVFTNTALPTLCWKLTTDICHIVTVLKTSQIWPVYADYRGTLLKPRFENAKPEFHIYEYRIYPNTVTFHWWITSNLCGRSWTTESSIVH